MNFLGRQIYFYSSDEQCEIIEKFLKLREKASKQNNNCKGKKMREIYNQIASDLGVNYGTLTNWMSTHGYSSIFIRDINQLKFLFHFQLFIMIFKKDP